MIAFPEHIQKRIDAGMGCWSSIGPGWMDLVVELDAKLAELHPDYVIDQVKEKFGGLRYYVSGVDSDEGYDLIAEAENKSFEICDVCGKPGKRVTLNGCWLATRCEEHERAEDTPEY